MTTRALSLLLVWFARADTDEFELGFKRHALRYGVRFTGQGNEDMRLFCDHFSNAGVPPFLHNGSYIELGALDGKTKSNTRFFHRALGWRGLLIEPGTVGFKTLARNRPGATIFNAAVCARTGELSFCENPRANDAMASLSALDERTRGDGCRRVRCEPMASLVDAARLECVDLFSLDVQGAELEVLATFDWARVEVGLLVVELDGVNRTKDALARALLRARGLRMVEAGFGFQASNEVWRGRTAPCPGAFWANYTHRLDGKAASATAAVASKQRAPSPCRGARPIPA